SHKLSSISMDTYNNDIQDYISDFRDILEKLKSMKYKLNNWYINNRFIDGLRSWQSNFIQMKRDELRDQNKKTVNKINQDQIMNLLIARTIDYKSKNKDKNKDKKPNKTLNTESNSNKSNNKNKDKNKAKFNKSNKTSTPVKPNTEKLKV